LLPETKITYFLDRNLGRNVIATAIRDSGRRVVVHDDEFSQSAKDEVWLKACGKRGWIILTQDKHIRYRANERIAFQKAKAGAIVLTASGALTGIETASIFLKALPIFERRLPKLKSPYMALVGKTGRINRIIDLSGV